MKQIGRGFYLSFIAELYANRDAEHRQMVLSNLDNSKISVYRQDGLWWSNDVVLIGEVEEKFTPITPYPTRNGEVIGFKYLRHDLQCLIEEEEFVGLLKFHAYTKPDERGMHKGYTLAYSKEFIEQVRFDFWSYIWSEIMLKIDAYEEPATTTHP